MLRHLLTMSGSFEIISLPERCTAYKYHNAEYPEKSAILWTCNGEISFMSVGGGMSDWHGDFTETDKHINLLFDCKGNQPFKPAIVLMIGDDVWQGVDYRGREITLHRIYTFFWDEAAGVWRREHRCSNCRQFHASVQKCQLCHRTTCVKCVPEFDGCCSQVHV